MREEREIYRDVIALLEASTVGCAWLEISAKFSDVDVFLAGGSVRDVLLKRDVDPRDMDFFLGGSGIEKVFAHLADTGPISHGPFGSPRWVSAGTDIYCDVIPIRSFFNGLWECEDILDVLNQFDFTGNAVAVHLREGVVLDPQNGRRDLSLRLVRAVRFDYPAEPISATSKLTRPAVVWFRILHYAAALEWTIEPVTLEWIRRHSGFAEYLDEFAATFFPLHPAALGPLQGTR